MSCLSDNFVADVRFCKPGYYCSRDLRYNGGVCKPKEFVEECDCNEKDAILKDYYSKQHFAVCKNNNDRKVFKCPGHDYIFDSLKKSCVSNHHPGKEKLSNLILKLIKNFHNSTSLDQKQRKMMILVYKPNMINGSQIVAKSQSED